MVGGPPAAPLDGRSARQPARCRMAGPRSSLPGRHQRVVDLEELAAAARRPPAGAAATSQRRRAAAGRGHRVVVELAGQEHLVRRGLELGEQLLGAWPGRPARHGSQAGRRPPAGPWSGRSRPAPWPRCGRPGVVRRAASSRLVAGSSRPEEASSSATELRRTSAASSAALARLQPGVQPVEAAGPPGDVDADSMASTAMTMMLVTASSAPTADAAGRAGATAS